VPLQPSTEQQFLIVDESKLTGWHCRLHRPPDPPENPWGGPPPMMPFPVLFCDKQKTAPLSHRIAVSGNIQFILRRVQRYSILPEYRLVRALPLRRKHDITGLVTGRR
jgi:hypothetical protein